MTGSYRDFEPHGTLDTSHRFTYYVFCLSFMASTMLQDLINGPRLLYKEAQEFRQYGF